MFLTSVVAADAEFFSRGMRIEEFMQLVAMIVEHDYLNGHTIAWTAPCGCFRMDDQVACEASA